LIEDVHCLKVEKCRTLHEHVHRRHLSLLPQFWSERVEILHTDFFMCASKWIGVYMQNFSPLASKLREKFEVTDTHMGVQHALKIQPVMKFLAHITCLCQITLCNVDCWFIGNRGLKSCWHGPGIEPTTLNISQAPMTS